MSISSMSSKEQIPDYFKGGGGCKYERRRQKSLGLEEGNGLDSTKGLLSQKIVFP